MRGDSSPAALRSRNHIGDVCISRALPLTYSVSLLRGIWHGEGLVAHVGDVTVLSGMFLAFTAPSTRVFRWE